MVDIIPIVHWSTPTGIATHKSPSPWLLHPCPSPSLPRPYKESPGAFQFIFTSLLTNCKFKPAIRGKLQRRNKLISSFSQYLKEIHHVIVDIVIHLNLGGHFTQQN